VYEQFISPCQILEIIYVTLIKKQMKIGSISYFEVRRELW